VVPDHSSVLAPRECAGCEAEGQCKNLQIWINLPLTTVQTKHNLRIGQTQASSPLHQ
jgi:hypothetical protein